MKKSTLANLSLALSPLPAIIWVVAIAVAMGEPSTGRSPEQMHAVKVFTNCALAVALVSFLACGWLSGRSFSEAPRRASAAVVMTLIFLFAAWNF